MSSQPVRDAFRAAWPAIVPGIPYADAINQHPDTVPAVWGTLSFEGGDRRILTMGLTPWVTELGEVTIHLFGGSGAGDAEMVSAATAAATYLTQRQLTLDLRVTGLRGPNDGAAEGEGAFFEVQVTALYEWQAQQTLA